MKIEKIKMKNENKENDIFLWKLTIYEAGFELRHKIEFKKKNLEKNKILAYL
jgi:hypothetical protein